MKTLIITLKAPLITLDNEEIWSFEAVGQTAKITHLWNDTESKALRAYRNDTGELCLIPLDNLAGVIFKDNAEKTVAPTFTTDLEQVVVPDENAG